MLLLGQTIHAQKEYGIFNSLAVGLNVGSTGIGVDVATPITKYVMLRGGVSFMPGITIKTDVDVQVDDPTADNMPTITILSLFQQVLSSAATSWQRSKDTVRS